MDYKECLEKEIITRTPPDIPRANQLMKMAQIRIAFWSQQEDDSFVALHVEGYYEIIKELIFAHIYVSGYNCTNHACLVAYLQEHFNDFSFETQKIDELRRIRNEIAYRGAQVNKDYLIRNKPEFTHIIKYLQEAISTVT